MISAVSVRERPWWPTARRLGGPAIAVAIYVVVLLVAYATFVAPNYGDQELRIRAPCLVTFVPMVLLTVLIAALLPAQVESASDFVLWMVFVLSAAPGIVLAQVMTLLSPGEATRFGLTIAVCMLGIRLMTSTRVRRAPVRVTREVVERLPAVPAAAVWWFLALLAASTYAATIFVAGFPRLWVGLAEVYAVRARFGSALASFSALGYLLPVVYNVVNPVFMARGIYGPRRGRWWWLLAGIAGQAFVFLTIGEKSVLLSVVLVLALGIGLRRVRTFRSSYLPAALSVAALTALVVGVIPGLSSVRDLVVRRLMVIPAAISIGYVAVFDDRPKGLFAGTPLFWLAPRGALPPSNLVGRFMNGDPSADAGSNLFGHGFFELGYAGMVVEALVLVAVLWVIDGVTRDLPVPVLSMILVMASVKLSGANVFTALTTHGLAMAIVICALLRTSDWHRDPPIVLPGEQLLRARLRRPLPPRRSEDGPRQGSPTRPLTERA